MIGGSIAKLLQIAGETKEALGKISTELPADVTPAETAAKIAELETSISELDAINAERTRLVNVKGDKAGALSDYLVHVRISVKAACGPDSSEYDMIGGTRSSERKRPKMKKEEED
ncbi:MAG: hypothetical protein WGN25_05340 [Candidatus Electrothrix sp. GW3-4]|uniref:hypothetical protein n=1 Tax=Candidatus Electrothrix sp. GW3-4 TaxID=3126740 RepID=UPI0030CE1851